MLPAQKGDGSFAGSWGLRGLNVQGTGGAWNLACGYGLRSTREIPKTGNAFARSFTRYQRTFIQPAIGCAAPRFDIALSCQAVWIAIGPIESSKLTINGSKLSALTIEPALTLSAGGRNVRFFYPNGFIGGSTQSRTSNRHRFYLFQFTTNAMRHAPKLQTSNLKLQTFI